MVKCQCKEYCDGCEEATMVCEDCGRKYCEHCAMCDGYLCECTEPQNIVRIKKKKKRKSAETRENKK